MLSVLLSCLPLPTQDSALAAQRLELPDGFRAELLYSVPKADQGSWVSLARGPDRPAGERFFTSDQRGALYRVDAPQGEGSVSVQRVQVDLGGAHGLLWAFDALYVVVGEADRFEPGLYRVTDTNGDDQLDTVQKLAGFDGSGEHGPHAVLPGPDGASLFLIGGNHTRVPEPVSHARPRAWGEDQLLPRLPDPNGHALGVMAPGGWVVRTDPDAIAFELIAMGMRNAYDMAFDQDGELFAYDSDMEWDVGTPWYRAPRVLHIVSGADYGWRHGSGKFSADLPDTWPAVADTDLSSPTGVVHGSHLAFPEPYDRALFIADWSYGRILVQRLWQKGATHTGPIEPFAKGAPFPVTDLCAGADGALYATTGGRGTQSGLYRISFAGELEEEGSGRVYRMSPAALERRRISTFHAAHDNPEQVAGAVWPHLASPLRFLRSAARVALEHQEPDAWRERALEEEDPLPATEALLALVRVAPEHAGAIVGRLGALGLEGAEHPFEVRLAALRIDQLALIRGELDETSRDALRVRLEPHYPSGMRRLDEELGRLLAALDSPVMVARTLPLLAAATTQEEALGYAEKLRVVQRGWTPVARRAFFGWFGDVARSYSGGHSLLRYVEAVRDDALTRVPADEREALARLAQPPVPPEAPRPARAFVREWKLAELVGELGAVTANRSFESGRAAWRDTNCHTCHRIAGEGADTGPDLTGAGGRFAAREVLEAILEPSRVVSDQYRDTELLTVDDELFVGRLEREDAQTVVLRTAPPGSESVAIERDRIAWIRPSPLSRMPSGAVDVLQKDELFDLLAYVLAGGEADRPAFQAPREAR